MNSKQVLKLVTLLVFSFMSLTTAAQHKLAARDSISGELLLADPTVITVNGRYYMAGTQPGKPLGFTIFESDDLLHWRVSDPAGSPQLTPRDDVFGTKWFWAPQFVYTTDKTYLFYAANEQVACAVADSINGRYAAITPDNPVPIDSSGGNIDPFLFRDTDGKYYLYHVRFDNGNYIWVGEYDLENGKIVENTLQPTFRVSQPWEHTLSFESVPVMEGPTVIKIDETYYLFYSCNHYMSKDYAVGYATAPTPTGPWTKNPDNPILSRDIIGEAGSGHGDIFYDRDGNIRYVFHTHNSGEQVHPRRARIVSLKLTPSDTPKSPARVSVDHETLLKPLLN